MNKTFNGKLIMNDDGQFELETYDDGVVNITKILDGIYSPTSLKDSQVYVKVNRGNGGILFEEDGGLVKKIDKDGVNSYHICGNNIDLLMFNHTEEALEITIEKGNYIGYGRNS
jgi:hypothetical protein